jgi:hypothetical protein
MFFIELPTKHLSTALLMFRSLEVFHKAIFVHCFLNAVYMITGFCTKIKISLWTFCVLYITFKLLNKYFQ